MVFIDKDHKQQNHSRLHRITLLNKIIGYILIYYNNSVNMLTLVLSKLFDIHVCMLDNIHDNISNILYR